MLLFSFLISREITADTFLIVAFVLSLMAKNVNAAAVTLVKTLLEHGITVSNQAARDTTTTVRTFLESGAHNTLEDKQATLIRALVPLKQIFLELANGVCTSWDIDEWTVSLWEAFTDCTLRTTAGQRYASLTDDETLFGLLHWNNSFKKPMTQLRSAKDLGS
jgi:hypothetical protein